MKKLIIQKMFKIAKLNKLQNYATYCCIVFFYLTLTTSTIYAKNSTHYLNQYKNEISKIEDFLNNIENLSCRFIQNSNGKTASGNFYLSRNKDSAGKMRIEYSGEPKILVIVNGAILSYHDIELDEISRLSTNTTPASFLTRPNISFSAKDVEITNVKTTDDEIKVSVMKKNRKEAGEFSLIFKRNPFEFYKMEVKNDLDQIISVQLKNIDFQSKIPDKFFVIQKQDLE